MGDVGPLVAKGRTATGNNRERQSTGLQNLASRMSLEPDQVEQEIEPFLLALGLVDRTAKGRMLTDQGKEIAQKL